MMRPLLVQSRALSAIAIGGLILPGSTACVANGYGSTVSHVVVTEKAVVVDTVSLGGWLGLGRDRSAGLGIQRERDVFSRSVEPDKCETRWRWFRKPHRDREPVLDTRWMAGGAIDLAPRRQGLTLGFVSDAMTIPIRPDEDRVLRLDFSPSALDRTSVTWQDGDGNEIDQPKNGECP